MNKKSVISSLILLLTALIWGFAFVAQKQSMDNIGPFTFNASRFTLGALCVLGFSIFMDKKKKASNGAGSVTHPYFIKSKPNKTLFLAGTLCGISLFIGTSLQQVGLMYTTVSRCSFVTTMYIVLVPIISIFLKKKVSVNAWLGVLLSAVGFYFLCLLPGESGINIGDLLTLIGSLFWAIQILIVDHFVNKTDGIKIAALQFSITAVLSIIAAILTETIEAQSILATIMPILYGGFLSVGVAFTLQILGQKNCPPTLASLILSLESVFAVLGGATILHESLTARESLGCLLIFIGVLLAQVPIHLLFRQEKSIHRIR